MTGRRLIIGVGNPDRGDDAAGPMVVRALRGRVSDDVELLEHGGEVSTLLELLQRSDTVYLVDAASSGRAPGTIHRFDAHDGPLPRLVFNLSTHGFGPAEAVELARTMDRLPAFCIVYAVEGRTFETGLNLSQSVAEAVQRLAERIVDDLATAGAGSPRKL